MVYTRAAVDAAIEQAAAAMGEPLSAELLDTAQARVSSHRSG